jgi:hypothetical protein
MMTYNQGECYAKTHWYSASVFFLMSSLAEVEIECSVEVNEDDNTDSQVINVHIINAEDIPEGYSENEIIDFVTENFE